jgi:hypothetical protein
MRQDIHAKYVEKNHLQNSKIYLYNIIKKYLRKITNNKMVEFNAKKEVLDEYIKYGICEHGYVGHTGGLRNCQSCKKIFCDCSISLEKVYVFEHIIPMWICDDCWENEDLTLECLRKRYNSYFTEEYHIQDIQTMRNIQQYQLRNRRLKKEEQVFQ